MAKTISPEGKRLRDLMDEFGMTEENAKRYLGITDEMPFPSYDPKKDKTATELMMKMRQAERMMDYHSASEYKKKFDEYDHYRRAQQEKNRHEYNRLYVEKDNFKDEILFRFQDKVLRLPAYEAEELHRNAASTSDFENIIIGLMQDEDKKYVPKKSKPVMRINHDTYKNTTTVSLKDNHLEMSTQEFLGLKQTAHSKSDLEAHLYHLMERKFDSRDDAADAYSYVTEYYEDRKRKHDESIPEEILMANKFLPFIVEKSKPPHIYQTLLSRSKGLNYSVIASVLYIVLKRGITDVQKFVKTLPDLPLDKVYDEIISHWQQDRVSSEVMDRYINLNNYFDDPKSDHWVEELWEFEVKDILIFMMVMSLLGPDSVKEYTDLDFMSVISNHDTIMNNIPEYVTFSDTGEERMFEGPADLEAFILYNAVLNPEGTSVKVKARFKKDRG